MEQALAFPPPPSLALLLAFGFLLAAPGHMCLPKLEFPFAAPRWKHFGTCWRGCRNINNFPLSVKFCYPLVLCVVFLNTLGKCWCNFSHDLLSSHHWWIVSLGLFLDVGSYAVATRPWFSERLPVYDFERWEFFSQYIQFFPSFGIRRRLWNAFRVVVHHVHRF